MILQYASLAINNVRHRGIRSWLTILGVFIGIAAVVSLISLGQSLQQAITGQFSALSADRLVIQNAETGFGPPGSTAVKKLTEHDVEIVKSVSGIKRVVSRLLRVLPFEYNRVKGFEFVVSIPEKQEDIEYTYDSFQIESAEGKLLDATTTGKIMIGSSVAEVQNYEKKLRLGTRVKINGKEFEIAGILKPTGTFQVNSAVFMPEKDLKGLLNIDDEIDLIVAQVESESQLERVAEEIKRKLRKDRNLKEGEEDFSVETPLQAVQTIQTILSIVNLIVGGIAAISLLVGGIGIANTMYTSVLERTKEIGTMKAVGAKNKDILFIFLIESGLIGLIGGLVGAVLGLSLAFAIAAIANNSFGTTLFNVQPSYPLLLASIIFAAGLGVLTGLLPAFQASRLKPAEALRK
ncbi:MAG TPA: ABC transporter permease [Candidatus Nanoarchaeia archaeon]|nr:ABC transporter permease [Candidatus Nanoarchaeia archaeon]